MTKNTSMANRYIQIAPEKNIYGNTSRMFAISEERAFFAFFFYRSSVLTITTTGRLWCDKITIE